jgi:dihydrofolate reductase
MIISLIAAIGQDYQLGKDNQMLWHIKEDFKQFKQRTMGHHLVMGRKTFESIGKALPGRTSIIVTSNRNYQQAGCLIAYSLDEAIEMARAADEDELFVLGGGQIYRQFLEHNRADRIYLSQVDYTGDADTFFPSLDFEAWKVSDQVKYPAKNGQLSWSYQCLSK